VEVELEVVEVEGVVLVELQVAQEIDLRGAQGHKVERRTRDQRKKSSALL